MAGNKPGAAIQGNSLPDHTADLATDHCNHFLTTNAATAANIKEITDVSTDFWYDFFTPG